MAVTYYGGNNLTCLSSDTKPLNIPDGARLIEIDTALEFVKQSGAWAQVAGGSGGVTIDVMANRPAASASQGKYYYVTDTNPKQMFFSDGTDWVPVTTNPLMQFWDGSTNTSTIPCTGNISANGTPPNPNTAAWWVNSAYNANAYQFFDGTPSWVSPGAPGNVGYYFGTSATKKVNKYRMYVGAQYPISWTVDYPAQGVTNPDVANNAHWTPVHQIAQYSQSEGWSNWFTFVTYGGCSAVRIRFITAISGGPSLQQIQFVEDTRS
jgi:hypothetical protein